MVENGFVTKEDAEKAKAEPLGVQVRQTGARLAASEFFAEEVRRDIIDLFGEDKLYGGGLSVRTRSIRACRVSRERPTSTVLSPTIIVTAGVGR